MNSSTARRWLHRFAWLTATLTLLLPVTTGAVVTTLKAGMVFADWPSSDGYNMLAYPWLSSARDQFVEHGHRLSGLTIGLMCIALAVFAWSVPCGRLAKVLATAIFATVFVQGMLGGARVLLDKETLALIHGDFAAGVFSLMAVFVLMTSSGWEQRGKKMSSSKVGRSVLAWAVATLVLIAVQYFFGGVLRHLKLGWAWTIHPWFALAPLVTVAVFAVLARRAGSMMIQRCAMSLVGLVVSQGLLGLATWYVRYGVPSWGVVAQHESASQIVVCSLHKVVGMLTLMTSVLSVVCVGSVLPKAQCESAERVEFGGAVMGAAT
jgi:heme a synthase